MTDQVATPEDTEAPLNRREPRLACNPTGVQARVEGSGRHFIGQIVEVSRTGIQIQIDEAVAVGSVMTVELGDTLLTGDIRHCEPRDGRFAVGIQTNDVCSR